MAVLAALVEGLAVFMYSEYCWVERLSISPSLTIKFCFRPVIGTVFVVPQLAITTAAVNVIKNSLTFFIILSFYCYLLSLFLF